MTPRLAAGIGAFLFLIAIALLLAFFLDLVPLLLFAIGLVVFVVVVAGLIVGGLVMILAVPYYFAMRPAEVKPGSFTLGQMKER